jgi:hypothetical protein
MITLTESDYTYLDIKGDKSFTDEYKTYQKYKVPSHDRQKQVLDKFGINNTEDELYKFLTEITILFLKDLSDFFKEEKTRLDLEYKENYNKEDERNHVVINHNPYVVYGILEDYVIEEFDNLDFVDAQGDYYKNIRMLLNDYAIDFNYNLSTYIFLESDNYSKEEYLFLYDQTDYLYDDVDIIYSFNKKRDHIKYNNIVVTPKDYIFAFNNFNNKKLAFLVFKNLHDYCSVTDSLIINELPDTIIRTFRDNIRDNDLNFTLLDYYLCPEINFNVVISKKEINNRFKDFLIKNNIQILDKSNDNLSWEE